MEDLNPLMEDIVKRLLSALEEKSQVDEKKKVVDEQVEALMDAATSLHRVYGGTLPDPVAKQILGDLGITDQVREALKSQGGNAWLQPVQVRGLVEGRGFTLGDYSNPMAVIHQVLKRLAKQGEVDVHPNGQHYKWKK